MLHCCYWLQDAIPLPSQSADLDPFTDSIEAEFGGFDFTDSRSRPPNRTQPRPLSQITEVEEPTFDTGGTRLTGFSTGDTRLTGFSTGDTRSTGFQANGAGETWDTGLAGFDTGYGTGGTGEFGYLSDQVPGTGYTGGYMPPPNYQSAVDGSDGGVTDGRGHRMDQQPTAGGAGRYWLRHRH